MTTVFADHHADFQASLRRLARDHFADSYIDRALSDDYAFAEFKALGDMGLLRMMVPLELGGDGADSVSFGIASEELGWADQGVATQFAVACLAHMQIANGLPPAIARRWLDPMTRGDLVCAVALTEPGAGSDAANISTRAERVPGGWRITGEKSSITSAPIAGAAVVMAKTDPAAGARGVSAFLVDLDDSTVSRQSFRDPGFRSVGRGALTFDGTFVPDAHLMGEEGRGFHGVMELFDLSRSIIGTLVVGGAQRALDLAADHVRQREAFGQPLSRNQGVSFLIAEHTTRIDMLRVYSYHSLALRDRGVRNTTESASIKWLGPVTAMDAIRDTIVLHGHIGWSDEMPIQAIFRDVSAYLAADGSPQIQKLLIARDVLGREAVDG